MKLGFFELATYHDCCVKLSSLLEISYFAESLAKSCFDKCIYQRASLVMLHISFENVFKRYEAKLL